MFIVAAAPGGWSGRSLGVRRRRHRDARLAADVAGEGGVRGAASAAATVSAASQRRPVADLDRRAVGERLDAAHDEQLARGEPRVISTRAVGRVHAELDALLVRDVLVVDDVDDVARVRRLHGDRRDDDRWPRSPIGTVTSQNAPGRSQYLCSVSSTCAVTGTRRVVGSAAPATRVIFAV